jgi:diacylglycerol kinase
MRLDNATMGIRRGGKLPMKDLVKAADGSVEGLKQLLKQEWELPEDTRVAVYVIQLYLVAIYCYRVILAIYYMCLSPIPVS